MKKVALVTGSTRGIGLETIRALGKKGYIAIVTGRTAAQATDVAAKVSKEDGIEAVGIALDVSNTDSIKAAVKEVEAKFGKLDALVNNAGIRGAESNTWDPATADIVAMQAVFKVNFFGAVECTTNFLPLIRKSEAGRIVNLCSNLGSHGERADPNANIYGLISVGYDTSKTALGMYTQELAQTLKDTNIKVNAVHPGWVRTEMGGPAGQLSPAEGAESSVSMATLDENGPNGGFWHRGTHLRW